MSVCQPRSSSSSNEHTRVEPNACQIAQTICSPDSTYQMLWEEPRSDTNHDNSEDTSVASGAYDSTETISGDDDILPDISRVPSPMSHARTKLAAWSWAREQEPDDNEGDGDNEAPRWTPLMAVDDQSRRHPSQIDEGPYTPPNTARGSSAFHSVIHNPIPGIDDDEEGKEKEEEDSEQLVELRTKPLLTFSSAPDTKGNDYLTCTKISYHSLPVSPLGTQYPSSSDLHSHAAPVASWPHPAANEGSRVHRDSVEISRHHLDDQIKMNATLMTTYDSFLLTRSRYSYDDGVTLSGGDSQGIRPPSKSAATLSHVPQLAPGGVDVPAGRNRVRGLPTIMDASPPTKKSMLLGPRSDIGWEGSVRQRERGPPLSGPEVRRLGEGMEVEDIEEEEHVGCAIYAVERPRWFEKRYGGRSSLMVKTDRSDQS